MRIVHLARRSARPHPETSPWSLRAITKTCAWASAGLCVRKERRCRVMNINRRQALPASLTLALDPGASPRRGGCCRACGPAGAGGKTRSGRDPDRPAGCDHMYDVDWPAASPW
jgi:hypothetical protein